MPSRNRNQKKQSPQIRKRTRITLWTAIVLAVAYAIVLTTSTVWENQAPHWLEGALEQRAKLLALTAAVFGLLTIITPSTAMPKAYLTTLISGGLTVYAAVASSIDTENKEAAIAILLLSLPVFVIWTSLWRMPRGWEWAGWSTIGSVTIIIIVFASANTPLGLLLVAWLGEDFAIDILIVSGSFGVLVLFVSLFSLAVKAVGMAQGADTEKFIRNQASNSKRGKRR